MEVKIDPEKDKQLRSLGGKEFLEELLEQYIMSLDKSIQDLRQSLENNNEKQVGYIVHSLKGASVNLGLIPLSEMFIRLDALAKEGKFSEIESEYKKLEDYLPALKKFKEELSDS